MQLIPLNSKVTHFDMIGQLDFLDKGCATTGADKGLGVSNPDVVFVSLHVAKPEGLGAKSAGNLSGSYLILSNSVI